MAGGSDSRPNSTESPWSLTCGTSKKPVEGARFQSEADDGHPTLKGVPQTRPVQKPSEHRIGVRGLARNPLQHIPVLDDPPVIVQADVVDARPVAIIRPVLIAVQDYEIPLGRHAAELHTLAGILAGHALEVLDERVLPVRDDRIVLGIGRAGVAADGLRRPGRD